MKVGVESGEDGKATMQLVDPAREMTVQDLLAAHLRPDLWHPRQVAGECRLYRCENRQPRRQQ